MTVDRVNGLSEEFFLMHYESKRLETFKDWPFEKGCNCTPQKMAEAGFYHCPSDQEPDLVKCFVCLKELDGWEPTDDPWQEHRSHSAKCAYLKLKNPKEMTVQDLLHVEKDRVQNIMRKTIEKRISEYTEYAKNGRKEIEYLL